MNIFITFNDYILSSEDIAPLEYAASVLDQEPNPMFVTQPNNTDVHKALTDVQAEPCGCKPKLAANIKLDGKTKDGEKDKIKDAIKDAFAKSNPGNWNISCNILILPGLSNNPNAILQLLYS